MTDDAVNLALLVAIVLCFAGAALPSFLVVFGLASYGGDDADDEDALP